MKTNKKPTKSNPMKDFMRPVKITITRKDAPTDEQVEKLARKLRAIWLQPIPENELPASIAPDWYRMASYVLKNYRRK